MLIDTHCHINLRDAFPDPAQTIDDSIQQGVTKLVVVGIDELSSRYAVELSERFESVFAVVGHHPNSAAHFSLRDLGWIRELLSHPKAVALGEIGLDFHWDYATREQQEASLISQLDLAADLQVPVVFHCRKAYPELLDILESRELSHYLFHCFSGTHEEARRALALGGILGVDGPITYKKSSLPDLFATIPVDRIVVETDSPYMPPEPFRGKPNHPKHVVLVNRALALAQGLTEEEMAKRTSETATRFFRLPTG